MTVVEPPFHAVHHPPYRAEGKVNFGHLLNNQLVNLRGLRESLRPGEIAKSDFPIFGACPSLKSAVYIDYDMRPAR